MRVLLIGGTKFLGRAIVDAALRLDHEVTLFHRGQTNPDLFPQCEHIIGDRQAGFESLAERHWDWVVDTCGFAPRVVRIAAEGVPAERYLFVSSISVFKDFSRPGLIESAEVATIADEHGEEITGESYGPLKALCEAEVRRVFGDKALIVRPGLIVGPHDSTDRFTYWPVRMERGGDVLVPDRKGQPVQWIDVRDLAEWMVRLMSAGAAGDFNAAGPWPALDLGTFLERIRTAVNPKARLVWTDPEFLAEQDVSPWADLPLYLGPDGSMHGMLQVDPSKAIDSGLTFRDLEQSALDVCKWVKERTDAPLQAGLSPHREQELLDASRVQQD